MQRAAKRVSMQNALPRVGRVVVMCTGGQALHSSYAWIGSLIDEGWTVSIVPAGVGGDWSESDVIVLLGFEPKAVLEILSRGPQRRLSQVIFAVGTYSHQSAVRLLEAGLDECFDIQHPARLLALRISRRVRELPQTPQRQAKTEVLHGAAGKTNARSSQATPSRALPSDSSDGPIVIDLHRQEVRVSGKDIHATAIEFSILRALAQADQAIVSRRDLYEAVHGQRKTSEELHRTLDSHICALRRKLGPAASSLVTVRSMGYRLYHTTLIEHPRSA